jgi:hypothetical protein
LKLLCSLSKGDRRHVFAVPLLGLLALGPTLCRLVLTTIGLCAAWGRRCDAWGRLAA